MLFTCKYQDLGQTEHVQFGQGLCICMWICSVWPRSLYLHVNMFSLAKVFIFACEYVQFGQGLYICMWTCSVWPRSLYLPVNMFSLAKVFIFACEHVQFGQGLYICMWTCSVWPRSLYLHVNMFSLAKVWTCLGISFDCLSVSWLISEPQHEDRVLMSHANSKGSYYTNILISVLALTVKIKKTQDFLAPISGSPGDQIFSLTFRNSTSIFLNSYGVKLPFLS